MSTKNYVVLGYYNTKTNSYSLSCRRDIATHSHFQRSGNEVCFTPDKSQSLVKKFSVLFEGPEKDAKSFRDLLILGYAGLGVNKLEMRQL